MITDERITELWNLASNTATSKLDWTYSEIIFATVRAAIAEHDVELRKQEPHEALRYGVSPNQCLRADTKEEGRQMRVSQKTKEAAK